MKFTHILKYFVIWQLALLLIASISPKFLPLRGTFVGEGTAVYNTNPLLYSRANFDGFHYVRIAQRGYGYAQEAFFPLYPNLIRFFTTYLKNYVVSGLLISNLSFLVSLMFLVRIIKLDFSYLKAPAVIAILLLFPTSLYFGSVYTESLFLALVTGSFYFARTKKWWLAGILGALASYTRFVGIFLFPALLVEWYLQGRKLKHLLPVLLIPAGLLVYMSYLNKTTGDPLAFFHVQKLYGQFRSEKIILLYQVFWRYIKMIFTVNRADPLYMTILLEAATGVIFLVTSIYSFVKHRLSYAIFNAFAYLVPTLTGSFVSLPRYILVCFPSFIIMASILQHHSRYKKIVYTLFASLLFLFSALFFRGYWIG